MKTLKFSKCTVDTYITLDAEGRLDDSQSGHYGFRVFYDVPKDEIVKSELFKAINEDVIGGQLEFSLDGDGRPSGEVLLWTSEKTEDGGVENVDFANYDGDIAPFVDDFFKHFFRW